MIDDIPAAQPATVDDTALREQIARALADQPRLHNLYAHEPAAYLGEDRGTVEWRQELPDYVTEVDAVLSVVAPVLAAKDVEIERLRAVLDAVHAQRASVITDELDHVIGERGELLWDEWASEVLGRALEHRDTYRLAAEPAEATGTEATPPRPYESCVLDGAGHCSRGSHTHDGGDTDE